MRMTKTLLLAVLLAFSTSAAYADGHALADDFFADDVIVVDDFADDDAGAAVPEPTAALVMAAGLATIAAARKRKGH